MRGLTHYLTLTGQWQGPTCTPAIFAFTNISTNVGTSPKKEPASPSKKPGRPELPKMKMGSVKNVTVGGASKII